MRGYVLFSAVTLSVIAAACSEAPTTLAPPTNGAGGSTGSTTNATTTTSTGPTVSEAEAYFEENVGSIFEGTCSYCHANPSDEHGAPDFLGLERVEYYDNLVERADFVSCDIGNSILLHKGADPGHAGPPLTEQQSERVTTWLEMEAVARYGGVCGDPSSSSSSTTTSGSSGSGGGPVAPLTGEAAMEQFGDCMTYDDWLDSGMPLVANQLSNYLNNEVPCYSCHNNPATGQNHMPNPNNTEEVMQAFENMRYMYASFNLVRWTTDPQDGSFVDLVPSYRWRDKGQEGTDHPSYELSAEYLGYYEDWYNRTYTRWVEEGPCGGEGGGGGAGGDGGGGDAP